MSPLSSVVVSVEINQYSTFAGKERSAEGKLKYLYRSCCLLSALQKCHLILHFILCQILQTFQRLCLQEGFTLNKGFGEKRLHQGLTAEQATLYLFHQQTLSVLAQETLVERSSTPQLQCMPIICCTLSMPERNAPCINDQVS